MTRAEEREQQGPNQVTSSYKKLWSYYLNLLENLGFISAVKRIRRKFKIPEEDGGNMPELDDAYWAEVYRLCMQYELDPGMWCASVSWFITEDMPATPGDDAGLIFACEHGELDCLCTQKFYPVLIAVSPHASKRDLLDWVTQNYKDSIKPLQDKYRKPSLIGKSRVKSWAKREFLDFIYANRHRSQKEIKAMVKEKFKRNLEYPYIGKLISREVSRRKKS